MKEKKSATGDTEDTEFFPSVLSVFSVAKKIRRIIEMKHRKRLLLFLLMVFLSVSFIFVNCGKQKRIQIILISIDTLRGDHITPYGYSRDTAPHLARLVRDSVYFTHAYTNGCWTMPSHMSLLTGTLPSRHGVNKDFFSLGSKEYPVLHESINSIPEILKSRHPGIKTIKFAKLTKDLGFSRGFDIDNYYDPFFVDKRFNKLLEEVENHKEKDFFLFIHTWMVHAPYTHSHFLNKDKVDKEKRNNIDNFRKIYREAKKKKKKSGKKVEFLNGAFAKFLRKNNLFNVDACIDMYDSGIRYVDQYIGRLIEKTKKLGIYDDLMIVVVSDHGEHFREHYRRFYDCHGYDYYEEFIKVPVIIKYPGQAKRKVLGHPVSLIDVVPTILNYYKIKVPSFVQGESLDKPYSKRESKYIVSEAISGPNTETKMIRLGHLKYMISMKKPNKPGRVNWERITRRRLYDIKSDPLEEKNLYRAPEFKNTCLNLEKMLKAIIENSTSPYGPTKETKVDKEFIEHMKSLGYL
jgi:hypothetical protein